MSEDAETAKREFQFEQIKHAREADEWALKERQLNEEIKRT